MRVHVLGTIKYLFVVMTHEIQSFSLAFLQVFFHFTACFLVSFYGEPQTLEIIYLIFKGQANLTQSSVDPMYLNEFAIYINTGFIMVEAKNTHREAAVGWRAD